ncbi:ATP-binding protein [Stappia sp. 28M-7]|uniref:sensor histidine kinase n=1 Tax=Stappia sp. 28M-7 TaxID=2762596 RepID=UPI00163C2F77|nr:ATP-binding protein [Stappia sp. 28M-7]MBC2861214.1 sensor histidine kinase [Stappia sp. 28M-7]
MTTLARRASRNALHIMVLCCALPVTVLIGWVTWETASRLFATEVATRAQALLSVQSATLERQLDKFRLLSPLLAQRPDVRDIILRRDARGGERAAALVAGMAGAQEVLFLDAAGGLIASSHMAPRRPGSTLEQLPLAEAQQGRLGRTYRRGDGREPGSYVFASAVRSGSLVVGIVVVRVSLAEIEQAWALSPAPIIAIDEMGEIVATNRPLWRGDRASERFEVLGAAEVPRTGDGAAAAATEAEYVRFNGAAGRGPYLRMARTLPVLDWQVAAFADTGDARSQSQKVAAIAVLICLLASVVGWVAADRRVAVLRRLREDKIAASRLERKVRLRTRDLSEANARLAREVSEREAAEAELRNMQADLVQAAKMATLGQMSAALSHEFNQPLAAIRSNADNAKQFLERDMRERVGSALDRIVLMVERMAEISRVLKGFSRRAGTDLRPTALKPVIDEAMMLLSPRVKQGRAQLVVTHQNGPLSVVGGHVRLEQVVLNLVANALDAVDEREDGRVMLITRSEAGQAVIEVHDNGPGISSDLLPKVFDPFFTTKEVGKGLGLGLSIAYKIVHDFSGSLTVRHAEGGGAVFTVRLPLAEGLSDAAE